VTIAQIAYIGSNPDATVITKLNSSLIIVNIGWGQFANLFDFYKDINFI